VAAAPKLQVKTSPPGAEIFRDGTPVGKSGDRIELKPDTKHVIEVKLAGYEPFKFESQLKAGDADSVMQQLVKLPFTLRIVSEPSGADVKRDGKVIGKTPLDLKLEADEPHALALSHPSKKFGSLTITGKPGASETKTVQLRAGPPPAEPCPAGTTRVGRNCVEKATAVAAEGFLTVSTKPWAKISIDGKPYGTTPVAKIPLAAGTHTIKLQKEGSGPEITRRVTVNAGEVTKQNWPL
jgi:hypothetical protein